jgi:predicted dehydrogenase
VLTRHGRVLGAHSLNQYQPPSEATITVNCQRGTARFEFHENRWRFMTEPRGQWEDKPSAPATPDTTYQLQANAFLDAIEAKSPPLCTLDEGIQTLAVNLAMLQSADDGSKFVAIAKDGNG